jgi:hypothetical protein
MKKHNHNPFSKIALILSACTLLFVAPAVSRADILFTNFGPGFSYNANVGNFVGDDGAGDNAAQADTFTSGLTETLSSIEIALSCFGPCGGVVDVSLRTNAAGLPGGVLETFIVVDATLSALGTNNSPITLNSILHPLLTSGTAYWVSVTGDPANSVAWNLNTTGDASPELFSPDGGATWLSLGFTPGAYEVNGQGSAVPEPASVPVLASMIAVIGVLTWRRRKASSVQVP